jgi:L-asparaginase II
VSALPVLVEVVRSGFVEGHHRGSVVLLGADGQVTYAAGTFDTPILPRSSNKPMQATGMVTAGLAVTGELLALSAASHSGEEFHLRGVRRILQGAGLDDMALGCPADLPLDESERRAWLRAGRAAQPLAMNCSGKHAAMLATCAVNGWPLASYLDPEHPLQRRLAVTVAELAGEPVAATAVDGCGAPLFALTLSGLARAFRTMVLAPPGTPARRVADAMRAHPRWVGGTRREDSALMAAVPGLLAKTGAEAVYAVALADGRALAVKIDDGAQRAVLVVLAAALRRLGLEAPVLDDIGRAVLTGAGRPVGELRPTLP